MANRVSNDQIDALLEFLTENPAIAKGIGLGARSKETVEKQWNNLAKHLNAFGSGSSKSGERWKKYWADLKHKSKVRLSKRRQDALGTGGGPSNQGEISEIDKKVLAIIGKQAVYGDSEHRVPAFDTVPDQPTEPTSEIYVVLDENMNENIVTPMLTDPPHSLIESEQSFVNNSNNVNVSTPELSGGTQSSQTGMQSPSSRPANTRRRPKHSRPYESRVDIEWIKELERSRTVATTKLSDAAMIIAESIRQLTEDRCRRDDQTQVLLSKLVEQTQALTNKVVEQNTSTQVLIKLLIDKLK